MNKGDSLTLHPTSHVSCLLRSPVTASPASILGGLGTACQAGREGLRPHQLCSLKEEASPAGRAGRGVQRAREAQPPQSGVGKFLQP